MHVFSEVVFKGAHRPADYQSSWIDVRDVGRAHVLAFEKKEAGGKRFLLSGGCTFGRISVSPFECF